MLDPTSSIEAGFLRRWMTVGKMKSLLAQLHDSAILAPNKVGNLSIVGKGYIDFADETVVIYKA